MNLKFDTIVIGGGLAGNQAAIAAVEAGKKTALFTTGYPLDRISYKEFTDKGGIMLLGDKVVSGKIENGVVTGIVSEKLGEVSADNYVLATGKFYSGGLWADMDEVHESIFDLDVWYEKDRSRWFDSDFSKEQAFLKFGLETDKDGHPFKNGESVKNLVATGGILKS